MADTIVPATRNPFFSSRVSDAKISAGVEAANARTVTIQLVGPKRQNLNKIAIIEVYLSDAATGVGLAAAAPSGGVAAAGTGSILNPTVAGKLLECQTDATGKLTLTVTEVAVKTFYVVVVLPDTTIATPFALAFA